MTDLGPPLIPPDKEEEIVFQSSEKSDIQTHKKNIPWFSLALLLGLAGIYLLFFLYPRPGAESAAFQPTQLPSPGTGLRIAYINSDSIKSNYQLVTDLQQKLEDRYDKLHGDITRKQAALEARAGELQRKYDAKQISMEQAQQLDEQLKGEGQQLYNLNQEYSDLMAEEEMKLNQVFIDSINHFLERFNKQYQFDYILGYSRGGGILYARDTLDITRFVLDGLNQEYRKVNPGTKKSSP